MLSTYYLELRTGMDYTALEYDKAAGRLVNMITAILSNSEHITALVHTAERTSCNSEIEVMLDTAENGTRELVAKVVVDVEAEVAVRFDKGKWTKLLKARPESDEWPNPKIIKRQVYD